MFKRIRHLSDIQPHVADKKEIRFIEQPNGATVGCYMFMDSSTFDSSEAIECRGIAFDGQGRIVSRPLHKFFNVGEKAWLLPELLKRREDIRAVYDKLDGSMIATAWLNGTLTWRSKKSFESDVVKLALELLEHPDWKHLNAFAREVASRGMTAIFELTHPEACIVVRQDDPALHLLHVRDNETGEYVLLQPEHEIHQLIANHRVAMVRRHEGLSLAAALESLSDMTGAEGYVVQFANGDMVKVKCPWYLRLHRSVALLRERDIARLALAEELDDTKSALLEAGIDLQVVEEVEHRLRNALTSILDEIEVAYEAGKDLDRKSFALKNQGHPLFGLIMSRYTGKEVPLIDWYERNRLKEEFGLRSLVSSAKAEAIEG